MTMIIAMTINLLNGKKALKDARPKKHKLKKDLMPIAWHPSRYSDWCMSEDEKQTEKMWA